MKLICKKTGKPCRMCMWGLLKNIEDCQNMEKVPETTNEPTQQIAQMETDELIFALRHCAANHDCGKCPFETKDGLLGDCLNYIMIAAADRLEELDERVAIMEEGDGK